LPGGLLAGSSVLTKLTEVSVFTSTRGNRYGFNPLGEKAAPYGGNGEQAALRVVFKGSSSSVPYPLTTSGGAYSSYITNRSYLAAQSVQPDEIKVLGVSSNFSSSNGLDFIYASKADKFTVQDSWWGRGGIAYEYYKDTGMLYKLDFVQNTNPTPEAIGVLSGTVEDIAIDGEGFLYVMRNEKSPSDTAMLASIVSASSPNSNPNYLSSTGWLRKVTGADGSEGEPLQISNGSELPGDYKEVTLQQQVKKVVKRYAPATGDLGTEENWGQVEAGYDYWTKRLEKKANGSVGWVSAGSWQQEPEADRNSLIPAELAVVNIAKIPEEYTPADPKPSIARLTGAAGSTPFDMSGASNNEGPSIPEGTPLSFKIEGYKPFINGTKFDFKNVGDVRNPDNNALIYSNLSLNLIPNEDGEYQHDEDNDGKPSGFPSSMFESSSHPTTITWTLDWVEENPSKTLLKNIPLTADVATIGADGQITITFPHPGNYELYAKVTYNKFDYSNLQTQSDPRPHKLTPTTVTVDTYKHSIKVYSNTLSFNTTKSFISNISLTPNSRLYQGNITPDTAGVNSASNYDLKEDEEITALEFSFTGQFVRDAHIHSNQTGALDTYNGIGVWDYNYYKTLYNDIKNVFAGMDYSISDTYQGHVYNYTNGTQNDIMSNVNLSIYNPGWKKDDPGTSDKSIYGTRVKESINSKDLRFIQWAIYLRPITPPNINTPITPGRDSIVPRGVKIASGHCAETGQFPDGTPYVQQDWSLGDRKCRFTIKMPMGRVEKIMTPIDPEAYAMHLEIIYPRVCWHNSDLGDGSGEKRFSSMVPYRETENGQAKPVHIISQIKVTENGNNYVANQSYKGDNGSYIFPTKDYWNVLVRDANIPQISESMTNEIIQTTNDLVATVTVKFAVADNNPMAEIGDFKVAYEKVNDNRPSDTSDGNKPFEFLGSSIPESGITRFKGPETTNYFSDNSWQQAATFTQEIAPYGPNSPFDQGNVLANWVGELNYTAFGQIEDGLGTDSRNIPHVCYHPDACSDLQITPPSEGGIKMFSKALTRIDNDPPTLEVHLISQIDNRRWVFKLEENEEDTAPRGSIPSAVSELGECKLTATVYNLQTGNGIATYTNDNIEGCTAYPSNIGVSAVNSQTLLNDAAAIPAFRRSSRLLVNVKATDNVAYKPFQAVSIAITDLTDGGNRNMLPSNSNAISTVSSIDANGDANSQLDDPRARFAIDMPMKVVSGTNQVQIVFSAQDQQGNRREITIPIRILDNTFNTRVLENKENRN
jgi:hypothetical protein